MTSPKPRLSRRPKQKATADKAPLTSARKSARAARAPIQQTVNESHEAETPWEAEFDQHVDDGWADADLPDLGHADDLDSGDPAREIPRRPTRARPKIRWWVPDLDNLDVGTQGPVEWAVRGPGTDSSIETEVLARHEERLAALAEVIARDHAAAVRAASLWEALAEFRTTTADHLYRRMDQRLSSVADNLTRLGGTVLQFPWGLTTLATLTKLSQKGRELPIVEPLIELGAALGDPAHPERLADKRTRATDAEVKAIRQAIAERHGCQENTLLKQQPGLLEVLQRPERVFSLRARQPLAAWERVAGELGPHVSERVAVMAVAGAFDAELVPLLRARLDGDERR